MSWRIIWEMQLERWGSAQLSLSFNMRVVSCIFLFCLNCWFFPFLFLFFCSCFRCDACHASFLPPLMSQSKSKSILGKVALMVVVNLAAIIQFILFNVAIFLRKKKGDYHWFNIAYVEEYKKNNSSNDLNDVCPIFILKLMLLTYIKIFRM